MSGPSVPTTQGEREDRIIAVFHHPRNAETEGHPVHVAVQVPDSNQITSTFLSRSEALTLYRALEQYLHTHGEGA